MTDTKTAQAIPNWLFAFAILFAHAANAQDYICAYRDSYAKAQGVLTCKEKTGIYDSHAPFVCILPNGVLMEVKSDDECERSRIHVLEKEK